MKSGGDTKRPPRLRLLSREELALWRHVTVDVKPHRKRGPVEGEAAPLQASETRPDTEKPKVAKSIASSQDPAPAQPPRSDLAPLAPLERRLKRKLSSGRVNVDCVIDLHGWTQAEAHRALVDFLWRASDSGARVVLVITGKGKLQNSVDHQAGERGVLRRAAPHWLRSAALRSIVLSIDEAARPHGGEGALYVRLRRRVPTQG